MDFAFSEEQQMLRDQARSYLADKFPVERVVAIAESDAGWDEESWREMAELGWIGLSAAEDAGGSAMTFLEDAVLFEELGYALYPGPFFATNALGLPALASQAELVRKVTAGTSPLTLAWAEDGGVQRLDDPPEWATKAERSGSGWTLTGNKTMVPDLMQAGLIVVAAVGDEGPGLWAVAAGDGSNAVLSPLHTMDATRRFGRLELRATQATLLVGTDGIEESLRSIRLRALAAMALEAVGIATKVTQLAAAYVSERKQFDKPIGTYQAVSHQVTDMYVDTELARSLAYWAAWCVAEDEDAGVAVVTAKAFAADAAVRACERSIQVHGGIGFTWEHVLHRYYKRAQWIESFEGYGATHRAKVAAALLDS